MPAIQTFKTLLPSPKSQLMKSVQKSLKSTKRTYEGQKSHRMLLQIISNLLSNEVQYLGSRQGSVSPDVIERKANTVIVPKKFKTDIEALERYIGHNLETGLCIKADLAELLTVIPRERKKD